MSRRQQTSESTADWRKYDPADFVIPATDTKGHTSRIQCHVAPPEDRALDMIVASKKFPFRTKGDVIRWAVFQGIRRLEAMEHVGPSVTQQVDAMFTILKDEIFHHEWMQTFEAMQRVVTAHMAQGAHGEAKRVIALMRHQIQQMPEGYWRTTYLKTLDDRFSNIASLEPKPVEATDSSSVRKRKAAQQGISLAPSR